MMHFIVFKIEETLYAIESAKIREVSRTKELRLNFIPKVSASIKGLVNLRGEIIPVMHLGEHIGIETPGRTMPSRLLIVLAGEVPYGVLVNQVLGHISIPLADLQPPTEEMQALTPYIKAIAHMAIATYFVIDIERLLQT